MAAVRGSAQHSAKRPWRRKPAQVVAIATLACAIGAVGAIKVAGNLFSGGDVTAAVVKSPPVAPVAPTTTLAPLDPNMTVLAAPKGTIGTYSSPGGPQTGTVGTWYGYPLVLPVIGQQPGWLQVRLPTRPNGSVTWVQGDAVTLSSTLYRIVVNLGAQHLTVYQDGNQILSFPVGIGTTATPTVTGNYFVAVKETHPAAGYGPFILDTSAHSEAIKSWEGSGDAIIAIHGPISPSSDARIGTTGTRISNGCIRMHVSDQAQLAVIPVGTPVDIAA
jgi:lipoprotein-anchoring transpeptidase ErfK/SrfK